MEITIVGPNLPRKLAAKGTFHVHAAGCRDLDKYPVDGAGDTWREHASVSTRVQAAAVIYPPDEFQWDINDEADAAAYVGDIWFAPCVALK